MLRSTDPENFFQTTLVAYRFLLERRSRLTSCRDSIAEASRKAIKAKNNNGNPIRLASKILAVIADPSDVGRVYVAEAAGTARRVTLEVGMDVFQDVQFQLKPKLS